MGQDGKRHITLDRAMWGTDQAASVEIGGLVRLLTNVRDIERSFGDGVKRVHPLEQVQRAKLRRVRPDEVTGTNGATTHGANGSPALA